ncbi:hypothetical protein J1N35_011519 [Gossypium stocksii]|uniref:Uncharacterized protein n=1 Tax=Gossypium stocksii TaxID=47602 RepID=A0A9D3W2N3_9ROSI|nr:hypothetical protein J1N35_011519 [Gossypium stocksii]
MTVLPVQLLLLGKKEELKNYFYTFCKLKPHPWSSKPVGDQESSAIPLMIIVGFDNRLVGDASTTHIIEKSSKESTSLFKEIDGYMGVGSFMQNVQGGPSVPLVILSPPGSPPPPRPLTEDTFGVIVQHGPLGGPMKFMFTSGETQTLFLWREHPGMQKFPYCLANVTLTKASMVSVGLVEGIDEDEATMKANDKQHKVAMNYLEKSHEEALEKYKADIMQSFQDYLPDLKSNFLLHA